MHVHFEESKARGDCTIQALSWMGRVPDTSTEPDTYRAGVDNAEEGWLASGNIKGTLGITLTATHGSKRWSESPTRANFNLRGHRSAITMVEWNEPYQKLATCDFSGVIFVWIKHEGRWSIELINDRNIQVTDFAWSHSGLLALIIYRDGFVLVGSVAGQRFWSSMLNVDNAFITCGIWTPDDQKVMFGTSQGHVVVMSSTGVMLSQVTILDGSEITGLAWSCERFTMDGLDDLYLDDVTLQPQFIENKEPLKTYMLAVAFKCGRVYLMSGHDDVCPRVVDTGLIGVQMAWSSEGLILAVGGYHRQPDLSCQSELHFYTTEGNLLLATVIPRMSKPLMALTWGHNDRRLFVAVGCHVVTAWVHKVIPSLEFLCRIQTHSCIQEEEAASLLPLPAKLKHLVSSMFLPTIKGYTPDAYKLREFVCAPPPPGERLYCTMIRHGEERVGGHYTLYLEHLGGMVPLLKGKRVSKIRPEFIIFDPKIRMGDRLNGDDHANSSGSDRETESEDDHVDGCGSPRMRRRKLARASHAFIYNRRNSNASQRSIDDIMFDDDLPESHRLVEVMSNIWGTKFKIQGMSCYLPSDLGSVQYRTSLLHLQPRQMTINLTEMRPDSQLATGGDQPMQLNGLTSESEEESNGILDDQNGAAAAAAIDASLPISPEATAKHFPHIARTPGTPGLPSPGFMEPGTSYMVPSHTAARLGTVPPTPSYPQQPYVALWKHTPPAERLNNYRSHVDCDNTEDMLNTDGSHRSFHNTAKSSSLSNPGGNGAGHCQSIVNTCTPSVKHTAGSVAHSSSLHSHDMQPCVDTAKPSLYLYQCVPRPSYKDSDLSSPSSIIKYIDDDDDVGIYNQAFQMSGEDLASLSKPTSYADQCKQSYGADNRDLKKSRLTQQDVNGANSDISIQDDVLTHSRNILSANRPNSLTGSLEDILVLTQHDSERFQGSSTVELKASSRLGKAVDSMHINKSDGILSSRKTDADSVKSFSLPSSPLHKLLSPKHKKNKDKKDNVVSKSKISSPLKQRRLRKYNTVDSSDDEIALNSEDHLICENYKDLESFQKAQLKQKLRRAKSKPEHPTEQREALPRRRYLVMHNKAPLWNEASQVYQLDFGGRVTQESAKNFQIEMQGKQVMQFGRIDSNAYTLDFQQPFCAIQAFAVALANVTQRLK